MPPPHKRACVAPQHRIRLAGPASPVPQHRVWLVLVSSVCVLAADVTRQHFGDDQSWRLEGWCDASVPVVVVIVCGNKARFGRLGREIISVDLPTVAVDLPGGGRRFEEQGRRLTGAIHETFVNAVFQVGQLRLCSVADATEHIAQIDCDTAGLAIEVSRSPQYELFVRRAEGSLMGTLAGREEKRGDDVIAMVPHDKLMLALSTLYYRPDHARQYLTTNMLWCMMSSFVMHCYRSVFGWYAVRQVLKKLLSAMRVTEFLLQELLIKSTPRLVASFAELRKRFLANVPPDCSDQWPWQPGSIVTLVIPFETASLLGYAFSPEDLPQQTLVHGGNFYLGPEAVRTSEMRGRANTQFVEQMLDEITGLAQRFREDPDDQENAHALYWMEQFSIPLAGMMHFTGKPNVMSARELNDYLAEFNQNSMRHEDRMKIGRALAIGMDSAEQRDYYIEQFNKKLLQFGDLGKDRMKQLLGWIAWYLSSR